MEETSNLTHNFTSPEAISKSYVISVATGYRRVSTFNIHAQFSGQVQPRNGMKVARVFRKDQYLQPNKAIFFEIKSRFWINLCGQFTYDTVVAVLVN